MDKLFRKIIESGILIGSRRWGGSFDSSDYDVVISERKTEKLMDYFDKAGIEFKDAGKTSSGKPHKGNTMYNTHNIKVLLDNNTVNIISYKENELEKIEKLNEAVDALIGTFVHDKMIADKETRIIVIESFLDILFEKTATDQKPKMNEDELDFL